MKKITKRQLAAAHEMEAAAIATASEFIVQFGEHTRGKLIFMLALKIIQDEYPNLYPNVAHAPQVITEWLTTGAKEMQHPMLAQRPAGKRLLNFPELNETKH